MRFQFVQLCLIFNPLGRYPCPPRLASSQAALPSVVAQVRIFVQLHAHIVVMVDEALAVGADVPLLSVLVDMRRRQGEGDATAWAVARPGRAGHATP